MAQNSKDVLINLQLATEASEAMMRVLTQFKLTEGLAYPFLDKLTDELQFIVERAMIAKLRLVKEKKRNIALVPSDLINGILNLIDAFGGNIDYTHLNAHLLCYGYKVEEIHTWLLRMKSNEQIRWNGDLTTETVISR